jgi:hypothetical protein
MQFWNITSLNGPSRAGPITILYCLIRDSSNLQGQVPIFISPQKQGAPVILRELGSSYNSQSYCGDILTRLHTGVSCDSNSSSSYIATDGQSASSYWCRASFGAGDQILIFFVWQLLSFILHVGRPLWREYESVICSEITQVQFKVILRPTVNRPVRLRVGLPVVPMTRF